jgi:hypothetical protein
MKAAEQGLGAYSRLNAFFPKNAAVIDSLSYVFNCFFAGQQAGPGRKL